MWLFVHGALAASSSPLDHAWDPTITRLDVESVAGNVRITARGDHIAVRATPTKDGPRCSLEMQTEGGVAKIVHRAQKSKTECQVDLEITLPAATEVHVALGAGNVDLTKLDGQADLEVGAGEVQGSAGEVTVELGAGNVDLDLTGPAEVAVGAGEIGLRYAKAPTGRVSATTGVGSVRVALPRGAPVRWVGRSHDTSHPVAADAPTLLDLTVALGSVEVE